MRYEDNKEFIVALINNGKLTTVEEIINAYISFQTLKVSK